MMRNISTFFQKNEKWLTPTALFGGFILDNITLRRVDLLIENILLGFYFLLVLGGILVWHKIESKKLKTVSSMELQSLIFLLVQFAFGGLFSSLTVFYIKSASFFASWPFLLLLFGGMIATEYFKKHFTQFIVQLGTLYLLLFTYLIMVVPLIVRTINSWVFVLSGILSLVVIFAYIFLFQGIVPALIHKRQMYLTGVIGGIFIIMNIFYFTNLIPPIPLALRDSGVYKSVVKDEKGYALSNFSNRFSLKDLKQEYTIPSGAPVYFFSSVYAPVKFKQKIVHEWKKKNTKGEWVVVSTVPFPIYGGNDSGYRGYTISQRVTKGEWKVIVKTEGGQVLGGESFVVR
jgi:hypothetical protein